MLFRNFHFCSWLCRSLPYSSPLPLSVGVPIGSDPCFVSGSAPVPSFPLLPAAEGYKKKWVVGCFVVGGWFVVFFPLAKRWWEASAPLALLSFYFALLYFSLFPLSRKPLLPRLPGICFTRRSVRRGWGENPISRAALRDRGTPPVRARCGAQGERGAKGPEGSPGGSGSFLPSQGRGLVQVFPLPPFQPLKLISSS